VPGRSYVLNSAVKGHLPALLNLLLEHCRAMRRQKGNKLPHKSPSNPLTQAKLDYLEISEVASEDFRRGGKVFGHVQQPCMDRWIQIMQCHAKTYAEFTDSAMTEEGKRYKKKVGTIPLGRVLATAPD
jgi:hypothetical protein